MTIRNRAKNISESLPMARSVVESFHPRLHTPLPVKLEDRNRLLHESLERWFGFSSLRPLQKEAVDAALDGRDALVVLPTGGGKSLCYQLPALVLDRLTIVVSPLIALMQDQVDGLRLNGVPAAASHSNLSAEGRRELNQLISSGELRILFVAPERLFREDFLQWLTEQDVAAIAIDEAHCISQWGHDFRPEYRRISELRERFPGVPVQAYTATATPRVREDICEQLNLKDPAVLIGTFDRPELTYRVLPRQGLIDQVVEGIGRHGETATIVYCISRKDTETLAKQLKSRKIEAEAYHAGLSAGERTRISSDFRAERLNVVCATVAFGMGIDRSDVRLVVHAAMPKSIEHYQQETGRAGRDGLPSECLLLYSGADAAKWRMIVQRGGEEYGDDETVQAQLALLNHMQRFAGRARCRHRSLSEYFGQDYNEPSCGACDVCLNELDLVPDSHVTAQKILSAVARTGQRYGASYVIDVLRGSRNEKVLQRGHNEIPTFGLLKDLPAMRLGNFIDQLIDEDVLVRTEGEYPVLVLNEASAEVLRSTRQIELRSPKGGLDQKPRRRRSAAGTSVARELNGPEHEVFDRLRAVRRKLASDLGVPPYVVFSDATLEELARERPTTRSQMLDIKGVGPKKVDSFGPQFLEALSE